MPRDKLSVDERLAKLRDAHPELGNSYPARARREQLARVRGVNPSPRRKGPEPIKGRNLSPTQVVEAKRTFLDLHSQGYSVTSSAKHAGVDPRMVYIWKEHDEQFSQDCYQAEIQALHVLEDEAFRRAVDGNPYKRTSYWRGEPVGTDEKVEYSDTLMMALLRARAPEKYRDRLDMTVNQVIKAVAGFDPGEVLGRAPHST